MGTCSKKGILASFHGRDHTGKRVGKDFKGIQSQKKIEPDQLPTGVTRAIEKRYAKKIKSSLSSVRKTASGLRDIAAPETTVAEWLDSPGLAVLAFDQILDEAMTEGGRSSD